MPGEHVVAVPPLELPSTQPELPLAQLRQNEAVRLFVERSAAGSGHFALTPANQAAVIELCCRLDGLPLAIELAAVRTRVLSVPQILSRLSDRFGLLTGGGQATMPRHQKLRTTIDWSHDLLTGSEQALLRRLCVFAGRFTVDDVESVCGGDDGPASQVLDLLSSLVDKSLVLKDEVRQVACYRLHETMREYASLKLYQAGEVEMVERRCAEYYRDRCRQTLPRARYRLVEWLDWMDLEIDNVRAVLQRCVAGQDARLGLDLVSFAGWYWVTRATSEGIRWVDELLALPGANRTPHALAQFTRGFLAVLKTDLASARPALECAAAAAHDAAMASLRVQALGLGSIAVHGAGDREAASGMLATAEKIAADLDDYPATIACLQARALIGLQDGDLDSARLASVAGVGRSRAAGDLYSLEMMLLNLGAVALIGRDLDEAKPLLVEALRIARRIDDRVAQYALLDVVGCHAAGSDQPRLAAQLIGAAETVQRGLGATTIPYLAPLIAQARQSTRSALGGPTFQVQYDAGRGMSRSAAIGLALGEPAESPSGADRRVHGSARQARGRGRAAGRRGPEQQADRRSAAHLGAHSGQSRAKHPQQAGLRLRAPRWPPGWRPRIGSRAYSRAAPSARRCSRSAWATIIFSISAGSTLSSEAWMRASGDVLRAPQDELGVGRGLLRACAAAGSSRRCPPHRPACRTPRPTRRGRRRSPVRRSRSGTAAPPWCAAPRPGHPTGRASRGGRPGRRAPPPDRSRARSASRSSPWPRG